MFQDALMESGGRIKTNSKWTALASLTIQAALLMTLILIPLFHTEGLPRNIFLSLIFAPPLSQLCPPRPRASKMASVGATTPLGEELRAPSRPIPSVTKMISEDDLPPTGIGVRGIQDLGSSGPGLGIPGGIGERSVAVVKRPVPSLIRVSSGVSATNKISGRDPIYPAIAKSVHLSGSVVMQAVISKSGAIENLVVMSGSPLLRQAAIDAVCGWRYKPTVLDGQAVEVQTEIIVNFTIGG